MTLCDTSLPKILRQFIHCQHDVWSYRKKAYINKIPYKSSKYAKTISYCSPNCNSLFLTKFFTQQQHLLNMMNL